jgi:hypothetical protein
MTTPTDVYLCRDFRVFKDHDESLVSAGLVRRTEDTVAGTITAVANKTEIVALVSDLAAARFSLAKELLVFIRKLNPTDLVEARQMVSRGYYAMYHASRACLLADSHDDTVGFSGKSHDQLPNKMGKIDDDPTVAPAFGDTLKLWRGLRNAADYDIYILTSGITVDRDVLRHAGLAAPTVDAYLRKCATVLQNRGLHVTFP